MNAAVEAPQSTSVTVADLVLVRYALADTSPKKVRTDVGKLLSSDLAVNEFDVIRAELEKARFLSKGPRNTFSLTEEGRHRAMQILGLSEQPPRLTWGTVIAKYMLPKAVGASIAASLKKGEQFAAFMLKRKYGLSDTAGTTVNQVLEAITCKELGYPQETTLDGLLRAVLSKVVGASERFTKAQLLKQMPLYETGLSKVNAEEARRMLVREWLSGTIAAKDTTIEHHTEPFDLGTFASTVLALAGSSLPEDRFHDNKVFIAPLWRASQRESSFPQMTLPEFKQRLIEANAKHLLHLSRADLVQAMDPRLVAESEIVHMNATFHFVLLQEIHQ